MRQNLSQALLTALGGAVQRPAWLVQINWPDPIYLSTYDTVTFNGQLWTKFDVDVSSVRIESVNVGGSIKLSNTDDTYASLVLNYGVVDRAIRIYGYDAGTVSNGVLNTNDVVTLVDCTGGRATISPTTVEISLRDISAFAFTPRAYVGAPSFRHLIPAGTKISVNSQTYVVERS